jgi:hypothetical protein
MWPPAAPPAHSTTYVPAARPQMTGPVVSTPAPKKLSFKVGELVVYPAHGVGKDHGDRGAGDCRLQA